MVDGEEEYEVEAIVSHRDARRRREYLVKWAGYSSLDNTWVPLSNLKNAQEKVDLYLAEAGISAIGGVVQHRTTLKRRRME